MMSSDLVVVGVAVGLVANIVAVTAGGLKLLGIARGHGERMGRLELKVDTMWDVTLKGAIAVAVHGGMIRASSPLRLNPETAHQFGELGEAIKSFYAENHLEKVRDSEVTLVFARVFGDDLLKRVCIPYGMNMGAALIAALQLCKEAFSHA